ncbi:MAG: VOC family protein [Salibacteraceae bacterium]
MHLGEASLITIGVNDLNASLQFYQQLGFRVLEKSQRPNPWAQITDGRVVLLLNRDKSSYISLTYFSKDARERAQRLQKEGIRFHYTSGPEKKLFQGIFVSPDNLAVNMMNLDPSKMFKPNQPTLRDIPVEQLKKPEAYPNTRLGAFGEFSHPVKTLLRSIDFWSQMGFKPLSINEEPYPWAIISDGINLLGLHQSKDFDFPAITYFAPDMARRIDWIRKEELSEIFAFRSEEGSKARNAVLKTPEKQHLFLFSI